MEKIYKQTEEHRRKISEANKGRIGEINKNNEKLRRERISATMKNLLSDPITRKKLRVDGKMKRKARLGYINSPETRIKLSNIQKEKWLTGDITNKQKQTLFIIGEDNRRMETQFKKEHFVPQDWRDAVKENRKNQIFPKIDSTIEVKIQNFLKELGISFFTHQYMKEIEHSYQCDILIPSMNLVIECDGDYWHKYPIGKEIDKVRTSELLERGI